MTRLRNLLMVLCIAVLAASCRPQPDLSRDFGEPENWGETFEIFWKKMSTNYLFWNLDYDEGRGWDDVYDEYKEKFDALGLVADETRNDAQQKANTEEAYRYFFDITKVLSDGHYTLSINDQRGNAITLSPSTYRVLKELGYDDTSIFGFFSDTDYRNSTQFDRWRDYYQENTVHIMEYSFGLPSEGTGTMRANSTLASEYGFSDMQYLNNENLHIALGRNDDGIVYFAFNKFEFYDYFADTVANGANDVTDIVMAFHALVSDENTTGVIIDMRGNVGGIIADMSILWTAFMPDDADRITVGETRRKASENRTDYSTWTGFYIERCRLLPYGSFNQDVPIAIIINENSVSCAEMSTSAFMSLRDTYDYDVQLFGSHSMGGMGALLDMENSEEHFNGGISNVNPYISLIYTPYCQTKASNGQNYEGRGIPADEYVEFDPDAFRNGTDPRLAAALDWIRQ